MLESKIKKITCSSLKLLPTDLPLKCLIAATFYTSIALLPQQNKAIALPINVSNEPPTNQQALIPHDTTNIQNEPGKNTNTISQAGPHKKNTDFTKATLIKKQLIDETQLDIQIKGIIIGDFKTAIIETNGRRSFVTEGDMINSGENTSLITIKNHHVIIDNDGKMESLSLYKSDINNIEKLTNVQRSHDTHSRNQAMNEHPANEVTQKNIIIDKKLATPLTYLAQKHQARFKKSEGINPLKKDNIAY